MKPQPETGFIDYKIQQVLGMVCLRSANAELILCKFREIVVTEGIYRKTKKNLVWGER